MNESVRRLSTQPVKAEDLVLTPPEPLPDIFLRRFPELRAWDEKRMADEKKNQAKIREVLRNAIAQIT